ncbi:uncharacterized protein isoform X2 [Rhodnius prolixus]|uniref:uncharacterized protein isoform X2 n=1 Tax=Rhodnius prolixus TaxID=13249 RepID=UPI003D18B2A5
MSFIREAYCALCVVNIVYYVQGELFADPNVTLEVMILNDTIDEGATLQEEWVSEAVLDVAYYLRSYKFNEYDRRFQKEKNAERIFYKTFPNPPLHSLHWEVHKNCNTNFLECLKYLILFISASPIRRSADPVHKAHEKGWKLSDNRKEIEDAEEECQRQRKLEEKEIEDLYGGPIQRFQWKTTAAYYMCYFTMQRNPELSVFGEPCDNYANCMWNGTLNNGDPRADDSQPFYCSMYRFGMCVDIDECLDNTDGCNEDSETCLNLRGSYACACAVGYRWNTTIEKCTPILAFQKLENISIALLMSEPIPPEQENVQTKLQYALGIIKEKILGNKEEKS